MGLSPGYDAWFLSLAATLEQVVAERGVEAVGEVVIREVLGAWDELPEAYREVFTANSPGLLAEIRGGERLTDNSGLDTLWSSDTHRRRRRLAAVATARN